MEFAGGKQPCPGPIFGVGPPGGLAHFQVFPEFQVRNAGGCFVQFSVVIAPMTDVSEAELLARYQRGDLEAFTQIYERFKAGLYGYALSLCGSAARAQDVTQDVWIKFIERVEKLPPDTRLGAYLYTVLRNRVIDDARRRKSEQKALEHQGKQEALVLPADPVAGAEEAARLNEALAELPEEQRETVLLRLYGAFTFEEMAELTGAPAKTVMSRHRLALEKLRAALSAR